MPSPIPKFPEIIENLRKRNFVTEVGYEQLRVEIMRVTGSMLSKTIRNITIAMSDLGYIKDSGKSGIFYLCVSKPYDFPQIVKDDEKELSKFEVKK